VWAHDRIEGGAQLSDGTRTQGELSDGSRAKHDLVNEKLNHGVHTSKDSPPDNTGREHAKLVAEGRTSTSKKDTGKKAGRGHLKTSRGWGAGQQMRNPDQAESKSKGFCQHLSGDVKRDTPYEKG